MSRPLLLPLSNTQYLFSVILGLLAGVELNCLADYLAPRGATCAYCGRRRDYGGAWALVAYLRGRGRCRSCAAPLPLRPLLVELTCTVGLPLLWRWSVGANGHLPPLETAFLAAYLFILLLLTITDLEQQRIPNAVIYPALGLALLGAFVRPPGDWRRALLGGAGAFVFFLVLYGLGLGFAALLGRKDDDGASLSPRALGGGDVKLATFVGLVSGWPGVVAALGLGMLAAAVVAGVLIVVRLSRRQYHRGQTMPYGPFLAAGAATVLLLGV